MKKLIYFLIFTTQISVAQNNADLDLKKIEVQLSTVLKTSKHSTLFKDFITDYKASSYISSKDLIFDYVGIGLVINPKNNDTKLLPAKYTLDLKTRLSGIGVVGLAKAQLSDEQLKFLATYTKKTSEIKNDDYYMSFKYHTFDNEGKLEYANTAILVDQNYTTYFAKKDNWLYAIGVSKTTDEFILYKFDTQA